MARTMCLPCLQNKLSLVILIALLQPLLYVGPDWFNPCGGCDCCVSSWQRSSGSLFLFQVIRMKHTATLTPNAPFPLGGRSKTSQQNLQGMFFIVFLSLSVLCAPCVSLSISSGQLVKASSRIDPSRQRKSKQAETAAGSNAWMSLAAHWR